MSKAILNLTMLDALTEFRRLTQDISVVSESGLYALIFSRKPEAKKFRKWVIRQFGGKEFAR